MDIHIRSRTWKKLSATCSMCSIVFDWNKHLYICSSFVTSSRTELFIWILYFSKDQPTCFSNLKRDRPWTLRQTMQVIQGTSWHNNQRAPHFATPAKWITHIHIVSNRNAKVQGVGIGQKHPKTNYFLVYVHYDSCHAWFALSSCAFFLIEDLEQNARNSLLAYFFRFPHTNTWHPFSWTSAATPTK